MKSGIYRIVNTVNGKCYIGSSKDIDKRVRQHMGKLRAGTHINPYLQNAYNKYGEESFYTECIENVNTGFLFEAEARHIAMTERKMLYNIGAVGGGDNISNHPDKNIIVDKISKSMKKHIDSLSEAERKHRANIMKDELNPNYGKTWTNAERDRVSLIVKDKFKENPERAVNISLRQRQRWESMSDDDRITFSIRRREIMLTDNPFAGMTHSDETKSVLRDAAKNRFSKMTAEQRFEANPQSVMVKINGTSYYGLSEAARNVGISPSLLSYRIKSKSVKWEGYKYIDKA